MDSADDYSNTAQNRVTDPRLRALLTPHGQIPAAADKERAIERALYTPEQFSLAPDEALTLRFRAICESFAYHFGHNPFYRRFCETSAVTPGDINSPDDLAKIPLVPEHIFKGSPGAEDFILWISGISSDELGWGGVKNIGGSYDEQIAALRRDYGILVRTTSGSSGIPSFLPRDPVTRRRSAHWKIIAYAAMRPDVLSSQSPLSVTLWPLDFSWADLIAPPERVHALLDKKLGLETVIRAMTGVKQEGFIDKLLRRKSGVSPLLADLAGRLGDLASPGSSGIIWAPPFLIYALSRYVLEGGAALKLSERWRIELGGGWKLLSEKPLSEPELRALAGRALSIPEGNIHDTYGSTECLGLCAISCEGGWKHVPHAVLHPIVLDAEMKPVPEGEWGRFAFLNPLIRSYPGFIVTGDRVRMLSRCPSCGRSGPVLDGEISRMADAEDRGCANIVREIISEKLGS
ncbi:MAG: LuxE/PaaK family acyltransferase [Deltaproteobacteria bacterium]